MTSETQRSILSRMDTLSEIETDRNNYQREFNGFRPQFKGVAQGYYPNTFGTYVKVLCVLMPAYIVCAVGLYFIIQWAITDGPSYAYSCLGMLIGYIVITTLIVYCGAFGRLKMERDCLARRRKDQLEKQEKRRIEREQAEKMLKDYHTQK